MERPPGSGSWPASIAVAIGIGLLLLAPAPPLAAFAPELLGSFAAPIDKLVHFLLFLLGIVPWRRSCAALGAARPGLAAWSFATLYAGALELAQAALTVSRAAEWGDLGAGALGAAAGLALAARRSGRSSSPNAGATLPGNS